ncbi:MAG: hypothetical protein ACKOFN_09340 [Vulcanococcus sp.]
MNRPDDQQAAFWDFTTAEAAEAHDAPWRPLDDADSVHIQKLLQELGSAHRQLAEARLQISELESLLQDLPEIFERKFVQRLQPVLERQEQLLADNRELQHQIRRLAPAPGEVRLRFNPESASGGAVQLPQLPQPRAGQRQSWGERLAGRRRAA